MKYQKMLCLKTLLFSLPSFPKNEKQTEPFLTLVVSLATVIDILIVLLLYVLLYFINTKSMYDRGYILSQQH